MFLSSLMRNVRNKMTLELQYINLYIIHLADDMKQCVTLVNKVINVRML
jgi:ketopantoate reductase